MRYDVVFLDCDLPRVSGAEVARRHRASETAGARSLIIATTALSTVEARNACVEAGMDGFISKPITPEKPRAALSAGEGASAEIDPAPPLQGRTGIDIGMIVHLTDGSEVSLERELEKYVGSLDAALADLVAAQAWGLRSAVSSAAHRLLSLARMVGAGASRPRPRRNLQNFSAAYTGQRELSAEVRAAAGLTVLHSSTDLEALSERSPISSYRAS